MPFSEGHRFETGCVNCESSNQLPFPFKNEVVNVTWPAQTFLRSYTLSPLGFYGSAAFVTAFKIVDAIAVRSATVQHWSRNVNTSK